MSTLGSIRSVQTELAREIEEAKKAQERMEQELHALTVRVNANKAALEARVRFQASLTVIQREAEQALAGVDKALAEVAATQATKIVQKPDEVRRKMGRPSKAEKAARLAEQKAAKVEARQARKADRLAKKADSNDTVSTVAQSTDESPKADGAKVTKVRTARRSDTTRPPIKDAIQMVLGDKIMTVNAVFEELTARGWLPDSTDPRTYIAYVLSSTKNRFENVREADKRGYRVKAGVAAIEHQAPAKKALTLETPAVETSVVKAQEAKAQEAKPSVVEAPATTAPAAKAPTVKAPAPKTPVEELLMSADDILNDAGILGSPAFGG